MALHAESDGSLGSVLQAPTGDAPLATEHLERATRDVAATSPLRWTLLSYRVPPGPSRQRVSIWRELKRIRAINLETGSWALRLDELGHADLDRVLRLIELAAGDHTVYDVADASPRSGALQDRLAAACNQMWDGFFNEADRLEHLCERQSAASMHAPIDVLRKTFISTHQRDMVFGDAGHRAARKLSTLIERLDAVTRCSTEQHDELAASGHHARSRVRVCTDVRLLQDGRVTYLATVDPALSIAREVEFADFEDAIFLPDTSRPDLTHNAFEFTCSPSERSIVVATLLRRLDLFAHYVH